jgi:hypothetical protein
MKMHRVEPTMIFAPPENCKAGPRLATNPRATTAIGQDKF